LSATILPTTGILAKLIEAEKLPFTTPVFFVKNLAQSIPIILVEVASALTCSDKVKSFFLTLLLH